MSETSKSPSGGSGAVRAYLRRLPESAVVAVWLAANLFVFGTKATYAGNKDMFSLLSFESLLQRYYLRPFVYLVVAIIGVALVMPTRAIYRAYVVVLFGVAVMTWVQGNFFVWDYGLFDGTAINFAAHRWEGVLELIAWAAVIGLLVVFRQRLYRHVAFLAGGLCLLQAIALPLQESRFASAKVVPVKTVAVAKTPTPGAAGAPASTVVVRSRPESVFEFSKAGNIIVYISDGFQSDIFSEIIAGSEHFADDLDGFVFFDDTATNARITIGAYTAMLTGIPYDGSVPFRTYVDQTIVRDNISLALYRKGFAVAHVLESRNLFYQPEHYVSPFVFTDRLSSDDLASRTLLDATFFRHAPHFAKPFVFDGARGLAAALLGAPQRAANGNQITAYVDFMDLLDLRMIKVEGAPTFKLLHLLNAHPPLSLNEDCKYEALTTVRENYARTNVCSMKLFVRFLARLKELGVYDNSLIIFLGDHGAKGVRTSISAVVPGLGVGDAWPALVIKPANSRGRMRVSHAPAMVADIAATIADFADVETEFPGSSLLSLPEGEVRERPFFFGKVGERWEKSVDQPPNGSMFAIRGPVKDLASWSPPRLTGVDAVAAAPERR